MATIKTLLGYVKGPKGDKGDQGVQGASGNDGAAASIQVGTTTTASSGTPARVENVGTSSAAVLNFTIPQGPPGSVGEIARYPVNEITSATDKFPVPVIGDTIATIVGKLARLSNTVGYTFDRSYQNLASLELGEDTSREYSVGEYLVWINKLYRVTKAMPTGNKLSDDYDGNIERKSVGSELTSLTSDINTIQQTLANKAFLSQIPSSVSVPSGQNTEVCTMIINKKGRYVVNYCCVFASNSNGLRSAFLSTNSSGNLNRFVKEVRNGVNGAETRLNGVGLFNVNTVPFAFSLMAYHTAGSTLTVDSGIQAFEL